MTQPYRSTGSRWHTPALMASQRGVGPMPHLQNARRIAMKRKPTRKARARYSSPLEQILAMRRHLGG